MFQNLFLCPFRTLTLRKTSHRTLERVDRCPRLKQPQSGFCLCPHRSHHWWLWKGPWACFRLRVVERRRGLSSSLLKCIHLIFSVLRTNEKSIQIWMASTPSIEEAAQSLLTDGEDAFSLVVYGSILVLCHVHHQFKGNFPRDSKLFLECLVIQIPEIFVDNWGDLWNVLFLIRQLS